MASGKKAKKQKKLSERPATPPEAVRRPALFPDKNQSAPFRLTILALALVVGVGLLIYGNSFTGPFLYDDLGNIQDNFFIRLNQVTAAKLKAILGSPSPRPFANLTFAINYYIHQYHLFGYHLVNVSVHIINAFLVFLLARLTMGLCGFQRTWIALPAALLWLVNPVHTQSVSYIVQRMNSLAAMFYLLSMLCYIQGRLTMSLKGTSRLKPFVWFIGCVLAGILGLLSKEIAATLPVAIFLYEWYFFRQLDKQWLRKQAPWVIFIFLLLFALTLIYLKGHPLSHLADKYANKEFTLAQRLLTEPGVVLYYLSLLICPFPERLRVIYQISPATGLISPVSTLTALIALAGLIAAAFLLGRRHRLISFAIVWFLTTLTIESSIIPLALAFEHRTYLPSVFLFIALATLLFEKMTVKKALILTCLAVVVCGIWTRQRNIVWTDAVAFWTDAAAKTPFAEAHNGLGLELLNLNRQAEAVPLLEKAIDHDPEFYKAYCNLGTALHQLGRTEEAEAALNKALELNPDYAMTHNNLGMARMAQDRLDEAIGYFQNALTCDPTLDEALNNLGVAYYKKGETDPALEYFRKTLALNPTHRNAFNNLNQVSRVLKTHGPSLAALKAQRQQHPDDPDVTRKLADTCQSLGMTVMAIDLYEQALALEPQCERCLDFLARTYWRQNRYDRATETLEQQARFYPETPDIFYGLTGLYAKTNQTEKAVDALKQAVARGFNDMDVLRNDKNMAGIRETDYYRSLTGGRDGNKGLQAP